MKPSLQLKLSQHLTLTPQLQQSIRLLQLSTLELNQELERFLQDNPLLERDEEEGEDAPTTPGTTEPPPVVVLPRLASRRRANHHSVVHPQLRSMPHHTDKARAEEVVVTSGLAWTILQPNAYLQNLAGRLAELRVGRYPVPYDVDARLAMVDLDDVAEVAARCVVDRTAPHATLELSGPSEVSARDVAAAAARLLGRPVIAERVDPATFAASVTSDADVRARLTAMLVHYDHHGSPGDATVLGGLLGRPPGTLDDVLGRLLVG